METLKDFQANELIEKFYNGEIKYNEISKVELIFLIRHEMINLSDDELINLIQQKKIALHNIPYTKRSKKICSTLIKDKNFAFACWDIPGEFMDRDYYIEAVSRSYLALWSVPQKYKTYDFYLEIVSRCGILVNTIPHEHKTEELCLSAVINNNFMLYNIPQKYIIRYSKLNKIKYNILVNTHVILFHFYQKQLLRTRCIILFLKN